MFVTVNGTKLFFDVAGAKLGLAGDTLVEKPTLIALHGGPGMDHLVLRSFFDRLTDIVQVVYLDHRGNGRSLDAPQESWTLAQWGDDIRGLCDQLGIARPIVFGNSFGGFVAQSYATRHPVHPAAIILSSTAARMDVDALNERVEKAGGPAARAASEQVWAVGDAQSYVAFNELVAPLFVNLSTGQDPWLRHVRRTYDVVVRFHRPPEGELRRFDFRAALGGIQCPALVLTGGDGDVVMPPKVAREMADALPAKLVRYECLAHCRHGTFRDDPDATEAILRSFIAEVSAREAARGGTT